MKIKIDGNEFDIPGQYKMLKARKILDIVNKGEDHVLVAVYGTKNRAGKYFVDCAPGRIIRLKEPRLIGFRTKRV